MKTKPYNLFISDEAEIDFDSSYLYYSDDSFTLADSFYKQIDESLETIRKYPLSFQKIHKNIRKFTVKHFPFIIYYQIEKNTIQIIAIFHTSRNPRIWKERTADKKNK